ncbi:DUF998 domain-containing protein [Armatimonas sp.]|uniref:DUF998 domain-containing protein n=1 Tax=Armatimonas sp. TaxID=1872638 RepID=UPI00286AFDA6|nr:DUF998 domain-containing protein [Armatimonas sp.]
MAIRAVRLGAISFALAGLDLTLLHTLPTPRLHATTGATFPYRPYNFLSELVRSDYGPWMTVCFFLLGVGAGAAAWTVHRHQLRRESALLAVASLALLLLGFFPTDLADLSTDAYTCGLPTRPEPCTVVGRIHNPLSTLVFAPIFLVIASMCFRRERFLTRLAAFCGLLAIGGIVAATLYLQSIGWQGRWWTGLMQRSLVFPSLLWMVGLLWRLAKK